MARFPFTIPFEEALSANGSVTFEYQVPTNQTFEIHRILHVSTGAFDITDIYDSEGNRFTNATASNGIPNTLLKDGADDYHGLNPFEEIKNLEGGRSIYIEVLDTSGSANTINVALQGVLIRP